MTRTEFFVKALLESPPPGEGCHPNLLGLANSGANIGLMDNEIFDAIRDNIKPGNRAVPDNEIWDAIRKCRSDHGSSNNKTGKDSRGDPKLVPSDVLELVSMSPTKPATDPTAQTAQVLSLIYGGGDLLMIGNRTSTALASANHYIELLGKGVQLGEHIIPNPLSGAFSALKSGDGETNRGDGCVASHRFLVVEFDKLAIDLQVNFWKRAISAGFPVSVIVHSGGKSVHGWVNVGVADGKEWDSKVRPFFSKYLVDSFGADKACGNPSRLSRCPGSKRADTGELQTLLYLNPPARNDPIVHIGGR